VVGAQHAPPSRSFWHAWQWWLLPPAVSLALGLYFMDPFIGDWDGIDYTMLSLAGYPSSMALGRNLFIFGNHFLYEIARSLFEVPRESAYLLFKYAVVAQAPMAVIACWILARDFSTSIYTATLAAFFLALSPIFVLYSGQIMTDVPSVLLLILALIVHFRGIQRQRVWMVIVGAGLMGLGINLRETVGFYTPWLVLAPFLLGWKLGRRELIYVMLSLFVFLLLGLGWFGYWFLTDPHYRLFWFGWRESLRQESARHPVTIQNLWPFLVYFFVSAPLVFLALPFAAINEWRERKLSPLLLLGSMGLMADLLLFLNYSTAVNWRYFLTGLPAIAPLSADFLIRWLTRRFGSPRIAFHVCLAATLLLVLVFGILIRPISRDFIQRRELTKNYREQLFKIPRDAVMIAGAQTIAVKYWKAIGVGEWETIGTGGGWPGDQLVPVIDKYLREGRRVFLDSDPRLWLPCDWQRDEIQEIVKLEKNFRFRRVSETIYEIRPKTDDVATDLPDLQRLLSENRPAADRRCPPGGA